MSSSFDAQVQSIYRPIQHEYSACDVSDALLKLKVPGAGFLPDIAPIPGIDRATTRIVAPVSTVLLVSKSSDDGSSFPENIPSESNIPKGKNWTDCPAPGTIVLAQQPKGQISALLGDIMVTRLKVRGVLGAVVDGRTRDTDSCAAICEDGDFQVWSKGFSAAGPSLEAKPWAVDVPLQVGDVCVNPGDILCADEGDRAITVIPRELLQSVYAMLPILKAASNGVLEDVKNGMSLPEAVSRHPDFYSNYK